MIAAVATVIADKIPFSNEANDGYSTTEENEGGGGGIGFDLNLYDTGNISPLTVAPRSIRENIQGRRR